MGSVGPPAAYWTWPSGDAYGVHDSPCQSVSALATLGKSARAPRVRTVRIGRLKRVVPFAPRRSGRRQRTPVGAYSDQERPISAVIRVFPGRSAALWAMR